ncbi:MAG: 3-hydroxyacyl-CoA dehydrogenase NAD-binding domain-containing protein, partial [Ilumatobacteraceae bacterium]
MGDESTARLPGGAAAIGCGVIGAGWVARLRLGGVDVRVFDPSPTAAQVIDEVHANAVAARDDLGLPPGRVGSLTVCGSIADACATADLVVESVPERLELKHSTLVEIDAACAPTTIIASSTSGFRPSQLATPLTHPQRLVVGHPFNPVYLIPLVEVVGGVETTDEVVERVSSWYRTLGMHPLRVRAEIDAHIADRLLDRLDGLLDDPDMRPRRPGVADVPEELLEDPLAVVGVGAG